MNSTVAIGVVLVQIALLLYTIFFINIRKRKILNNKILLFLSFGVCFDVIATVFMIIGSSNSPFSLHGLLGYSSLSAMLIDAIILWRLRLQNGINSNISPSISKYTLIAYL